MIAPTTSTGLPWCDYSNTCQEPAAYVTSRGWVACRFHGLGLKRDPYTRVRKLRPHELNRLRRGEQVTRY